MTYTMPIHRPRRLRINKNMRDFVASTNISLNDIICPLFIIEGTGKTSPVKSLPNISRYTVDTLVDKIQELYNKGIKGFALFPYTPSEKKDDMGTESINADNLINSAMRSIKEVCPDCILFADVALDPYTNHGHDGVLDDKGYVLNDKTVKILTKQAVVQAQNGADVICPSDMMDGSVEAGSIFGGIRHN